jgi:hypothetical protein
MRGSYYSIATHPKRYLQRRGKREGCAGDHSESTSCWNLSRSRKPRVIFVRIVLPPLASYGVLVDKG